MLHATRCRAVRAYPHTDFISRLIVAQSAANERKCFARRCATYLGGWDRLLNWVAQPFGVWFFKGCGSWEMPGSPRKERGESPQTGAKPGATFVRQACSGRVARTINAKTNLGALPSVLEGGAFDFVFSLFVTRAQRARRRGLFVP
jgi:hypothetical protein